MRRAFATVPVLVALAVSGCGADTGGAPTPDGSRPSSAPGPSEIAVESVTVYQSGGIAGVERMWRITPDSPGSGPVFAAASEEAVRDAGGHDPTEVCCDFFLYEIEVRYTDGQSVLLSTTGGERATPAVRTLLAAVLRTQPSHDSETPQ